MKKTLTSILLILSLLLTLAPGAMAASTWTEADSAVEMAELLAVNTDTAPQRRRAKSAEPVQASVPARVLLYADGLPDDCGAQRVLHCAAWREFVLEFADEQAAQTAYETLTGRYGLTDCWLGADLPEAEVFQTEPAPACLSWGGAMMGLDALKAQAGDYVPSGRRVTVALIDTGADVTVPQLAGRTVLPSSYDFVNGTSVLTDLTTTAAAGHGTKVASLVADLTPDNVELMILRVFNTNGTASAENVKLALQYALDAGADVINLSLGWERAKLSDAAWNSAVSLLKPVLNRASMLGVSVVCAAGNSASDVAGTFPANHSATIAVSALNQNQTFAERWTAAAGSNYGPGIDFCAPGTSVQTGKPGGGIATTSGTSLAAPHITAAAADVLLAEPAASAAQVYQTLRMYASDLGVAGKDNYYGWGCPVMTAYFHDVLCPELAFADMVPFTSWAHEGLDYCITHRLLYGMSATTLEPNGTTTRAQFVSLLWRMAGEPAPRGTTKFTDLTQNWYRDAVVWAEEAGVVCGVTETVFNPNGAVTREQSAAFLQRYAAEVLGRNVSAEASLSAFPDAVQVSTYARASMAWAVAEGLVAGVRDGNVDYLEPLGTATRAQVAAILMRFDLAQQ